MKQSMFLFIIILLFIPSEVFAACSASAGANQVIGSNLTDLLSGKTVCVGGCTETIKVDGVPTEVDIWCSQELHAAGGILSDYKKGPGDPVDPPTDLGTWAVTNQGANTIVTYEYTTFVPHDTQIFKVWDNGSTANPRYSFCRQDGTPVVDANIITSSSGCGSP